MDEGSEAGGVEEVDGEATNVEVEDEAEGEATTDRALLLFAGRKMKKKTWR